jgi:xanthine dehydrogenase molybdenum-binding subunit
MVFSTCGLKTCLEEAAKRSGFAEKRAAYARQGDARVRRGIGIASMIHVGGGAKIYRSDGCGTILSIDDYATVSVLSGASDIGQGAETVIAQVVATELGLDIGQIQVILTDTAVKPWDVGVHASRTTFVAGNSARVAAEKAREKLLAEAAELTGRAAGDLGLAGGQVVDRATGQAVLALDKLLRTLHFSRKNEVIITSAYYEPPSEAQDREFKGNVSPTYAFATQVAEVAVDLDTGLVTVERITAVHDVGRVINPLLIQGQVHGGVALGLGYCLSEELQIVRGRVQNPNFADYKIMTAPQMPPIDTHFVETLDPEGPYGAKGIGEAPAICTAPAVTNAVYQATGKRFHRLPLNPERVLQRLREQDQENT